MFSHRLHELNSAIATCSYSTQLKTIEENEALERAFQLLSRSRMDHGIVYVIGNGGSAGIASHFSSDLMKALRIPSQTLYDSNLMTCLSNDTGYENVFSYPLERLLKPADLLVSISSSGKSPNILKAVQVAISKTVPIITLSGFSENNPLRKSGDLNFWINRSDYGLIETAHFFLLHTIVDSWAKKHIMATQYA